jgi:rubredoxin
MYRFILQTYTGRSSRFVCPSCSTKKSFTRYVDTSTGEILAENVGKCDREINCGYHYTPNQHFKDNNIKDFTVSDHRIILPCPPVVTSYIPQNYLTESLKGYRHNNFITFLNKNFTFAAVKEVIDRYQIGTSKYWPGGTVFWQVDIDGRIRTGKIMLYDEATGKRVKIPYNHINWVHKVLKISDFNLKQCLFGEHLLKRNKADRVGIVESEKTAIIASLYYPDLIWLATGSQSNLTVANCGALKGRDVILFPDLNAFDKWQLKSYELSDMCNIKVSDILEKNASAEDRLLGLDIADYLLRVPLNR